MERRRTELLQSPLFLIGLCLLLLNDLIFKYEFSNPITGKLSDFAGLFIFPFFFAALFPKWIKSIYTLTIAIFIYWNSELSSGLIHFFKDSGLMLHRTIDPTDFIAFIVLPISYYYFINQSSKRIRYRKTSLAFISFISLFSFVATTAPRAIVSLNIDSDESYSLNMSKSDFFKIVHPNHGYSNSHKENMNDSLFYVYYSIPEKLTDITALVKIKEVDEGIIQIAVLNYKNGYVATGFGVREGDKNIEYLETMHTENHNKYFELNFISPLKNSSKSINLYFDNKRIHDKYLKQINSNQE